MVTLSVNVEPQDGQRDSAWLPKGNSLNLLRLAMALLVIVSHT